MKKFFLFFGLMSLLFTGCAKEEYGSLLGDSEIAVSKRIFLRGNDPLVLDGWSVTSRGGTIRTNYGPIKFAIRNQPANVGLDIEIEETVRMDSPFFAQGGYLVFKVVADGDESIHRIWFDLLDTDENIRKFGNRTQKSAVPQD